jgi:phosphopantothenoylcysteine decarboxylase/phosphopantothenate--cysteine ligase
MGFAIAESARTMGADVTVIAGPTSETLPSGVRVISVETAREMYDAAVAEFSSADYVIAAAAVSDYRPSAVSSEKIKKEGSFSEIALESTDDILAELGRRKKHQVLVGFAAETESLEENAQKKLSSKNLDWIVANDVTAPGAGFDIDTNIVQIYSSTGQKHCLPQMTKREVADQLWSILLG